MKQAPRFGERWRPADSVGISWGTAFRALMAASHFSGVASIFLPSSFRNKTGGTVGGPSYRDGMTTARELFLASDAALRNVIDRIPADALSRPAPAEWTRTPDPTFRDILAAHAFDEAWVPDVVAGRTAEEVGDAWSGDLLGDDPIGSYDRLHDAAAAALAEEPPADAIAHLSYGDYPLSEALLHMSVYRAFQAWSIAHELGIAFHLPPEVVDGMNELVVPRIDEWRPYGIFPPAIEPPAGADAETVLLCVTGYGKA
jgi:hypothetical protein